METKKRETAPVPSATTSLRFQRQLGIFLFAFLSRNPSTAGLSLFILFLCSVSIEPESKYESIN